MKFLTATLLFLFLANTSALAHPEKRRAVLEPESNAPIHNEEYEFSFQLVDTKTKSLVTDANLEVVHEKKLHFIAYDSALKEFQHVHPDFDGKAWNVKLGFAVSGNYWLWAQGVLKDGEEFSAPVEMSVNLAGKPAWPVPQLKDVRAGTDGVSKATLNAANLTEKKMAMLTLKFSRTDGSQPQITPFLDAFAHVIAVSGDADTMVHIHPMDGGKPEEGMLHVTFPRRGMFRLWVQFVDGGQLRVVPLSIQIL